MNLRSWLGSLLSGGEPVSASTEEKGPKLTPEELGRVIRRNLTDREARLFELQSRNVSHEMICEKLGLTHAQVRLLSISLIKKLRDIWKRYDVERSLRLQLDSMASGFSKPYETEMEKVDQKD